jgi:hypothetical protein
MKICWDNLENLVLTRFGNFRNMETNQTIKYNECCMNCGEPFLSFGKCVDFCSNKCFSLSDRNNFRGRKHTEEAKRKMSAAHIGIPLSEEHKKNIGKAGIGRTHTEETKMKISKSQKGKYVGENSPAFGRKHTEEAKRKISKANFGKNNGYWKGGYWSNNIATYDVYAPQIDWCEEVRRNPTDKNILEVKCFKCDEWFIPTLNSVNGRIQLFKKQSGGESNLYCSDECKHSCSIFHKTPESLMKQDAINVGRLPWHELTREVQPELRQLVIDADGYKCVKCNSTEDGLHCHHIYPASTDPLESADVDNCMMVCKDCHIEIHQKDGCGPIQCVEYY